MTARKRASHVARGRRHQGRAAKWNRQNAEKAERERVADERRRRELALTEAERALRAEERIHRQKAAASRLYREEESRDRERRIAELRIAYAERERELSEYAGVMVTIPKPEPARDIRRKPEDQAVTWSKAPRTRRLSVTEQRRLNGLD